MANIVVTSELNTLLGTLSIVGKTITIYRRMIDDSAALHLARPDVPDSTTIIIVIEPAPAPTTISKLFGSDIKSFTGIFTAYTTSSSLMDSFITALKALGDTDINLDFYIPDYQGELLNSFFWCYISYKWDFHISH